MSRFFNKKNSVKLSEIRKICEIKNDLPDIEIQGIKTLDKAQKNEISSFHNLKYKNIAQKTEASACFVQPEYKELLPESVIPVITDYPYRCFAQTIHLLYPQKTEFYPHSQECLIHKAAKIGKNCNIGLGAIIGPDAVIGDNTTIGNNTYIGQNTVIGEYNQIDHNVTIMHTTTGNHCRFKSGVIIGYNGFGFEMDKKGVIEVPHVGEVKIGNHVAIGANTTIDRGTLENTEIGDFCRLDNLVMIGHNVKLGKGVIIVAQAGIAGSTEIGDFSVLAGQVGIAGHLKIGKNVKIAAQSGVAHNIADNQTVAGSPAIPAIEFFKQIYTLKKITKGS